MISAANVDTLGVWYKVVLNLVFQLKLPGVQVAFEEQSGPFLLFGWLQALYINLVNAFSMLRAQSDLSVMFGKRI